MIRIYKAHENDDLHKLDMSWGRLHSLWRASLDPSTGSSRIEVSGFFSICCRSLLGLSDTLFIHRLFQLAKPRPDGKEGKSKAQVITMPELIRCLSSALSGTALERKEFFFDIVDIDGNGELEPDELLPLFTDHTDPDAKKGKSRMKAFLAAVDADGNGSIDIDEWCSAVERNPSSLALVTNCLGGVFGDGDFVPSRDF